MQNNIFRQNVEQDFFPPDTRDEGTITAQSGGDPIPIFGNLLEEFVEIDTGLLEIVGFKPLFDVADTQLTIEPLGALLAFPGYASFRVMYTQPTRDGVTRLVLEQVA